MGAVVGKENQHPSGWSALDACREKVIDADLYPLTELRTIFAHGTTWVEEKELREFAREVLALIQDGSWENVQLPILRAVVDIQKKAEQLAGPQQSELT